MREVVEALNQIRRQLDELSREKETYQGKTGAWKTAKNGDHIFFPDDGSPPLAMNRHTKSKGKAGKASKSSGGGGGGGTSKPPPVPKDARPSVKTVAKAAKGGSLKDPAHRKKLGGMIASMLKRKKSAAMEFAKKEIAEIKAAPRALAKLAKGTKFKDLDHHDQEALKATGKAIAMTVVGTIGFGVGGAALAGAKVGAAAVVKAGLAKSGAMALAKHFAAEALLKTAFAGVTAGVDADGFPILEGTDDMDKVLSKVMDAVMDGFANLDKLSPEEIERIVG